MRSQMDHSLTYMIFEDLLTDINLNINANILHAL